MLSTENTTGDGKRIEAYASMHNVADWIEQITGITPETPGTTAPTLDERSWQRL